MCDNRLPDTDSVEELAELWDKHDLTDFEGELEAPATLPSLAIRAEERRPLGLHNATNLAAAAAARAGLTGAVVYAVMVLVAAFLVEGVAIRAVAKRRAFVSNGR
jgi:hypothetical protein